MTHKNVQKSQLTKKKFFIGLIFANIITWLPIIVWSLHKLVYLGWGGFDSLGALFFMCVGCIIFIVVNIILLLIYKKNDDLAFMAIMKIFVIASFIFYFFFYLNL